MGLGGVTVRLSGMGDAQTTTDDNGGYEFRGLRAGTYSVEISSFDSNEVSFSSTSGAATVGVGETKVVPFDGTYVRTAGIQGQVTIDGEGLQGVTVTLNGEGEDRTEVTNAAGQYSFSRLKSGTYQVGITNPDPEDYEFAVTSKSQTIATGEVANVPFEGTLLRTAGIAGRVSLDDGMGLDGVTVTLAGAAEATTMTANGGQYAFAGLAAGSYIVSISNPDANAYNFADSELQKMVELMDDQSAIVNFTGTHTRTASISGMLFIDEVVQDKAYTDGEPSITAAIAPLVAAGALDPAVVTGLLAKAKVKLRGPDLSDPARDIDIQADGSFSTGENLVAGTYQVELPVNDDDVAAGLAAAGVAFVGESMVVTVDAGGNARVDFPFRITMQTVATGARMGGGGHYGLPVAGVKLALYARADGTDMLGEATTDKMGAASFTFARADNTGPAANDNIVFVKVMESGHGDLEVSGNEFVEIAYASTARLYAADAEKEVATLVNVAVAFDFWVKSNEMARSGDMGLGGWNTLVFMGDPKAEGAKPLMMEKDGAMVNATMPTNDGMKNKADLGKSTFAYKVDKSMLPATFVVVAAQAQAQARGEVWEQGDPLTRTHTGLDLPPGKDDDMLDLGPLRVTFKTQRLVVGVYRETDDRPGFTDYQSKVDGGDQRPSDAVSKQLQVELMVENSRGRLVRHEYKAFDRTGARTVAVANPMPFTKGMASFPNLEADKEFTVRFHAGSDRKAVVDTDSDRNGRDVDAYGGDLEDGSSVGAFGDEAGAVPHVMLCPMSSSVNMCSTFAYQWATGSVSGKVNRRSVGVGRATVNLRAITDNHSPDDNTRTSNAAATRGAYGFSAVQDGEYWVQTPATANNKADSVRLAFYHDEDNDDDADDGVIGNPASHSEDLDVTALRLEIRGFVANDGQEGDNEDPDLDDIVRGDEAVAGIELELLTITKVSTNKKDTTFKVHDKVMTDDDGSYAFENVVEGSAYYVRATGSGIYRAAEASAMDGFSRKVAADEYPAVEEGDFDLPYWNYNAGRTENTTVTVRNAAGTVSADFVNFALLYSDGTISGRVREASGSPGNITIELIRCETYDADDEECATYDRDNFPTKTTETKSNGTWEFNDLLEGWYEIYVGDSGYLEANIDGNNQIDDDGDTESADMHSGLVKGKRDLAAGNNFYVYDKGLDDDDDLGSDGVVIKGTTDPEEDPVELTSSSDVITWASKTVTVTPDIHRDASFAARTASRGTRPWPQSKGVATVEPDYNKTGSDAEGMVKATEITVTVTAENGYDDTDYTYMVYRAAPVGNEIVADDFTVEAPGNVSVRKTSGVIDAFGANVGEDVDDFVFTIDLEDIEKQEVAVELGSKSVDAADRKRGDGDNEVRFKLALADGANTVDITVTSEDDVDRAYQLVIGRGAGPGNTPAAGKPTIMGDARVGATLTANTSGISDADGMTGATLRYQWISNNGSADSDISGATNATYMIVDGDVGNTLKVKVSFTDDAGYAEMVTSDPTARVAAEDNNPASGQPTISGDARVGETLTADASGITDDDGLGTFAFQWISNDGSTDTDIAGATNTTYMIVDGDVGNTLKVRVSFTDGAGNEERVTSAPTERVTAEDNNPASGQPTISGTAQVGQTLTAGTAGIRDDDGMTNASFEYQWIGNDGSADTDIAGATAMTYVPVAGDVGNTLKVRVSFTDDAGNGERVTSAPTVAVVAAPSAGLSIVGLADPTKIGEGEDHTFTVRLNTRPTNAVTVAIAAVDGDGSTVDLTGFAEIDATSLRFTSTDWEAPRTVTIKALEDNTDTDDHEFELSLDPGAYATKKEYTVEITDDDAASAGLTVSETTRALTEGADGLEFDVELAAEPLANSTVTVTVKLPDNAKFTIDEDELTFDNDNWDEGQTVTVTASQDDDAVDEAAASLTFDAEGGGYGDAEFTDEVAVSVTDDDEAGIEVSAEALEVREGASTTYTVRLTAMPAEDPVTVAIASSSGDAYTSVSSLSFFGSNWDRPQTVTVHTRQDTDEADDDVDLTHTVSGPTGSGFETGAAHLQTTTPAVDLTIKDNELAAVVVSHTTLNLMEGQAGSYTLSLTEAPATGETVTVTIQAQAGLQLSTASVSLTANNWESGVAIRVTPAVDNLTETDETATLNHVVANSGGGSDAKYGGVTSATAVTINISDRPSS